MEVISKEYVENELARYKTPGMGVGVIRNGEVLFAGGFGYKDLETKEGDEVAVLMNGLGATPLEELYIMYRRVYETLTGQGIKVWFSKMGEFATSMDMAGASISVMKLDDELKKYLAPAADTPFIHQNAIG